MKKEISNAHYHVWTDALHLRELARQTPDKWDRATYVRASMVMAWTAFETALAEILGTRKIGGRFRKNVDSAVQAAKLHPLDWSQGVWQKVGQLNNRRVDYVHRTATAADLFPEIRVVDEALSTIRTALSDISGRAGVTPPEWTDDDSDRGWVGRAGAGDHWYAHVIRGGVDPAAPDTIRVAYVDARGEHVDGYYPSDADAQELVADFRRRVSVPISVIRVYRGSTLEYEWTLTTGSMKRITPRHSGRDIRRNICGPREAGAVGGEGSLSLAA